MNKRADEGNLPWINVEDRLVLDRNLDKVAQASNPMVTCCIVKYANYHDALVSALLGLVEAYEGKLPTNKAQKERAMDNAVDMLNELGVPRNGG